MKTVGTVESLWRYPVKSMRGEEIVTAFMGFSGFYGDRCFAFKNSAARAGYPYLNANAQPQMLLCRPRFRHTEKAAKPPNLDESMNIGIGVTPVNPERDDLILDVVTPSGAVVAIDDAALIEILSEGLRGENNISLVYSERALTDCRPISLISLQTIKQIETETSISLDKLRFRANIYFNLTTENGFAEDEFVGRKLRIGQSATIMVLARDPRCKMISLDPETGEHDPNILRKVAQNHGADAGVYCAVLVEGVLKTGDSIELVDD